MAVAAPQAASPDAAAGRRGGGVAVPPGADLLPVDLGGRCELLPGSPLIELNSPGGTAWVVRSRRDKRELMGLVVNHDLPVRIDMLSNFRGLDQPALLRVIDWGTVDWTPEGRRRFAVVLERPAGGRLFSDLETPRDPLAEEQITRHLLPALATLLKECQARGLVCGGIRPTNLFFRDRLHTSLALGDCVTTPVGLAQPAILEPIERAMAEPAGRGKGSIADDLYALGVTLLIVALGRNPVAGLPAEEVLQWRIERGSYTTLTAGHRLPQNLLEPLRGLMADDIKLRWTLADLDLWLQGRRMSPKIVPLPRRGSRPLEFDGQELWFNRSIARGLAARPSAAATLIDRGDLDKWLRRSLGDDDKADQVRKAVSSVGPAGGSRTSNHEDRVLARVTICLDPAAPIRYRSRSILPEGLPVALAESLADNGNVQPLVDMLLTGMPGFWVSAQPEGTAVEWMPMTDLYDVMRGVLEQPGPGQGIERVLYDLNYHMPCLSPVVREFYVLSCNELLQALEQVAERPNRPRDPMDRHIAAFVAAHTKKLNERLLTPLAAGADPQRRMVAVLTLLAEVQRRTGPSSLPALCGWLAALIDPALKRFHSRATQDRLREEAKRVARQGDIDALVRLVDSPETLKRDEHDFAAARRQYDALGKQADRLHTVVSDRDAIIQTTGRQVTAAVATVLATLISLGIVFQMLGR
jgi:eukaryotic-like serine/threonine-protein kinase